SSTRALLFWLAGRGEAEPISPHLPLIARASFQVGGPQQPPSDHNINKILRSGGRVFLGEAVSRLTLLASTTVWRPRWDSSCSSWIKVFYNKENASGQATR